MQLLYNLMKTNIKDGSKKYAETLGYSLNASGEIDYASVVNDNMYGPYTVDSAAASGSSPSADLTRTHERKTESPRIWRLRFLSGAGISN